MISVACATFAEVHRRWTHKIRTQNTRPRHDGSALRRLSERKRKAIKPRLPTNEVVGRAFDRGLAIKGWGMPGVAKMDQSNVRSLFSYPPRLACRQVFVLLGCWGFAAHSIKRCRSVHKLLRSLWIAT